MDAVREFLIQQGEAQRVVPLGRQLLIGSREDADLRLEAAGVAATHVMINPASRGAYLLIGEEADGTVQVNGEPVTGGARLADGDRVELPGLSLEFRFVPASSGTTEAIRIHADTLTINRLLGLANSAKDEPSFLQEVLEVAGDAVRANASAVMVQAADRLQVVARTGDVDLAWLEQARLALAERSVVNATVANGAQAVLLPLPAIRPAALLCLARLAGQDPFSREDVALLITAARQTAVALRRLRVMRDASTLQEEVLEISEQEQRRIGQDLHDGLCQDLLGIAYLTKHLEHELEARAPDLVPGASRIVKLVNEAMGRARGLARGLCPMDLEEYGLAAVLRELALDTERAFSMPCTFRGDEEIVPPSHVIANHLYYLVREAVANAAKHSGGTRIEISMAQENGRLLLTVSDDGSGLPADSASGGMGLRTMRYRARLIGADLSIDPRTGGGTRVACSLRCGATPESQKRTFLVSQILDEPVPLFPGGRYLIGRGRDADVRLRSDRVSRHHAEIRWDRDCFVVADLGSTNATELNQRAVHGVHKLRDQDVISFGGCEVQVVEVGADEAPGELNMATQVFPRASREDGETRDGDRETRTRSVDRRTH